ncbi:hypothetical protein BG004_005030 [Podila humilis]|nr:hypothetical protein BG004_005030 [Podila humilis]
MTNSTSANRSPSPGADGSSRCMAIAVSTGQRCSKSGKLDGYCSVKHKEQGGAASSKNTTTKKAAKKASSDHLVAALSKSAKKTPTKRVSATKAKKAYKKAAGSEDEFVAASSDEDYRLSDVYTEDDSTEDPDSEDEDDDAIGELTDKLKTAKIKPDDPSLPPRPAHAPLSTKLQRVGTKIVNTNKLLPPPKSKVRPVANTTDATTSVVAPPTHGGFWVPAPAPVKIPESTRKALAAVKDKLRIELSSTSVGGQHSAPEKKSSGFFSYRLHIQNFLKHDEPEDDDNDNDSSDGKDLSKRAQFRKFFGKLLGGNSNKDETEESTAITSVTSTVKPEKERPLPALPTPEAKKQKPSKQRRDSQASVESITNDIQDLSIKRQDSTDDSSAPNQCQGFNSNGYRCKRKVKLDRPIVDGEVLLCHDHEIEDDEVVVHIEGQGGVLLQWLDVSVWVNPNLPDYVQTKLRRAMEKAVSDTDKPGYIYTYQLLETRQNKTHTFFKVGRTDNVHRRMNEWSDKCGSPPILLEVFPEQGSLAPKDESDLADSPTSSDDKDLTGLRCRYAHRVERLIHIELKPFHDKDHVCSCKTAHREWFMVPHRPGLKGSQQMDQAWEQIRRVIVHWMAYMERVYGPG